MFESGVASYITLQGVVTNNFPVDNSGNAHVVCSFCRYYSATANKCRLTEEIVYGANKYIGNDCPLNKEEQNGIEI